MADNEGGSEQDDVSFLRTEDNVCLSCTATGERVCLAAEGFGNRHCFLENIADKNSPPDLSQCVFVIEQALSVRALQELVTAAGSESGKGTGSGHRTLLYGNAVLLRHHNSDMYLACLSTSSGSDKLAFDVGLQEHCEGEACWWTIHPASKQRSEGEKVRVGDDLILVSVATERYLQSTKENGQSIVNASFHVTHWSVQPYGTGISRMKYVGYVFGGEVLRFFHGGDECLTIPSTWSAEPGLNIVVYEGGAVVNQARSLWILELARTKWAGGFINWFHPMRIRHITTGRYLAMGDNNTLVLVPREEACVTSTCFYLRQDKDDQKVILEDKDLEVIGAPLIKFGDSTVIVQHVDSSLWLSYRTYETKKKGIGKVEEKQAVLHEEGKMDDGLEFSRSQEEESRTARVIRKCSSLFTDFIRGLNILQANRRHSILFKSINLGEMINCLEDLINYFAQPEEDIEHEERQKKLRALRNRQDLFQQEGILNLILEAIDKINVITSQGYLVALAGEEAGQNWDIISAYLYQLLAAVIMGNHTNCAQFAQSQRLNWLFSRLGSQAAGEGSGMLDVLHCILIDSPEALNMMKEEHIKVIISLLEKHGRDPKVLDVLCSLCVGNKVAVRSSQNNICDYLLPGKNLLLQTQLVDHVASAQPNIFVGKVEGSAMFRKWYYEVTIDHIETVSHLPPHLRIGWANTMGYVPYPGGGEKWGGNGIGDDLYSYGFDGSNLWTGGRCTQVNPRPEGCYIQKFDVIGVSLDLDVPIITFTFNGQRVRGSFRDFNVDGMFFPVVSCSAKVSCRFLLGGEHGRLKHSPPELHSPLVESLLTNQLLNIEPCFQFGDLTKNVIYGPADIDDDTAFVPTPVDTSAVMLPQYVEQIRDKLAENIHELWAMTKIEQGWMFGEYRDDMNMKHPCLTTFEKLPAAEKRYDMTLALQTLKTIMALGWHITVDKPPSRIRNIHLSRDLYMQPNGYKPAPLDLGGVTLQGKLEELVDMLSENTHNVWAKERIQQMWTYGLSEDSDNRRSPHLVPYPKVDEIIKTANRNTASEAVKTLLIYGYNLEPPQGDAQDQVLQKKQRNKFSLDTRTYRAEKTYAVTSGRWYFEVEVLTSGPMKVGWAKVTMPPGVELGGDDNSWAFDGYNVSKFHANVEDHCGKQAQIADVIGCMLDLHDRTISFSLNGERMMDAMGSETAFTDVTGEAFVPAITLGVGQRAKLAFGQDVNALKYFTTCGLQEGYEPFCVNMLRPLTLWYTKDLPMFENTDEDARIQVTRIPAATETPPCLKISHKTFDTMEKSSWEFLRLSLPVICQDTFITEEEKTRRWTEIRMRQQRLKMEEVRAPAHLEQSIIGAGFSMADLKGTSSSFGHGDLQRGYPGDGVEADEVMVNGPKMEGGAARPRTPNPPSPTTLAPPQGILRGRSPSMAKQSSFEEAVPPKPERGRMSRAASEQALTQKQKDAKIDKESKKRGKSPFKFFKKREQSADRSKSARIPELDGTVNTLRPGAVTKQPSVRISQNPDSPDLSPTRDRRATLSPAGRKASIWISQSDLKMEPPPVPDRAVGKAGVAPHDMDEPVTEERDLFDQYCLDRINEYFYGVRIFPGQDPTHVYVGWLTTQYHIHDTTFNDSKVRKVIVTGANDLSRTERQSCYMVSAGELHAEVTQQADGKAPSQGMFIGCFIDTATGYLTFTCEGKPTSYKYKMEPGTKLFPAIFADATSKEMLQFELGRTPTTLPFSAAVLQHSGKHVVPQFPPRLKVLSLKPYSWARVPNVSLKVHSMKLSDIRGWSIMCEDPVPMIALHIPEEDRCIDVLELIENERLLSFHSHTLALYCAVCYQSNYRAAHTLCSHVDEKQLRYAIKSEYMSGPLRRGFYDLLIALHLESNALTRLNTQNEYIVPLCPDLSSLYEDPDLGNSLRHMAAMSIRPKLTLSEITENITDIKELSSPYIDVEVLRNFVMNALEEAVQMNQVHNRDPIGESNENLFVPLLKLADKLLLIEVLDDTDVERLLIMIDPESWDPTFNKEGKDEHRKGLLVMDVHEGVKLQICYVLHHMYDIQLRHRVEHAIQFSEGYCKELQQDQLRRYVEIKQSDLPSAIAAKKTKEFRCPPKAQMKHILTFRDLEGEEKENAPLVDSPLATYLEDYHGELMGKIAIKSEGPEENAEADANAVKPPLISRLKNFFIKKAEEAAAEQEPEKPNPEEIFKQVLTKTIVRWAEETQIEDLQLVREMFALLLRQYNGIGELMQALEKSYVISISSHEDVQNMLVGLSSVRSLLPVQMSQEEEELMRKTLWALVRNRVFFQHPDLIRILRMNENVMAIMVNTLSRREQAQSDQPSTQEGDAAAPKEKDTSHEMVVSCCRFLCYFCRSSRLNQKAMFDHLAFLLDNSNILLSRPSLRGSTPLDVAASSIMDNTELALALREHYLEKIAVYLSRCGLQSNTELLEKGYPDLGWDPVDGERYLDFLRVCVFVSGESVEENANMVIRLLIRRPECLGPALRGEGEGLLKAIIDGNQMSEKIAMQQNAVQEAEGAVQALNFDHPLPQGDDDEDYIDTGSAILSFYCTLVDLLGRCAPEAAVIALGKNEALRARAILRSLVPLEDLVGVLSLQFNLQNAPLGEEQSKSDMPPGLIPLHKQCMVAFLERVYGIEERELFFRLLEEAFLPDLRAATMLDRTGQESEMALALNRYLGNSVLPLLIKHSKFYAEADNYASILDATLHTVYRLSKVKILTKGQRESVSDFLVALTREMHPAMLLKLLRKLTVDVSNLSEYTTVALRLLTLHFDRCSKYYGAGGGQSAWGTASEEEKRLTMMLFNNIFDSLSKMEYNPDLFSKSLPCLIAIGCSLPPDYTLTSNVDDDMYKPTESNEGPYDPKPIETMSITLNEELTSLVAKFSEHYHDAWASRKLDNSWSYGEVWDYDTRTHPRLKPYGMLSDYEKGRYKEPIRDCLKALVALGWNIEYALTDTEARSGGSMRRMSRTSLTEQNNPYNYRPRPVDMANLTLSRDMQNMAERLAENLHDIWAKKKKEECDIGGGIHPQLVPYDLLTDKEKKKDRERSTELLKYLQYQGYKLHSPSKSTLSRKGLKGSGGMEDENVASASALIERRFSYQLLQKLLQYVDICTINMKLLKPSANYSRRSSFKTSSGEVKFFSKVVLHLMEKYFSTHKNYFIAVATVSSMSGAASLKEKEMVASLFCKLANLLRSRMASFSSSIPITVKCLQVLVKAIDARSLSKLCPEFIRTSMLTFFNSSAEDLCQTIINLQQAKFSLLRGTHLKTSSSINYVQLVQLPVLTSLFNHLAANDFGTDLLLDDIQVACYKILNSLYILGSHYDLYKTKKFIKTEIDRFRPSIGSCLGAFASVFPVAFLEPHLNKYNPNSIQGKSEDHSLAAQDVMAQLESSLPTLESCLNEVDQFVQSGKNYYDAPHVIDMLLPMMCSYLPFWWAVGPDAVNVAAGEGAQVTLVTSEHLNQILKSIVNLIKSNVGIEDAPWMIRIATYSQQVIINSSDELLKDPFLPLATKMKQRTENMYHKEDSLRGFLKSSVDDTSQVEAQIQEAWHLIVRDIYAFYPLLIKYVDLQRSYWLKENVSEAEEVYNDVAEIFNIWLKSQYFQKEETNFISQNEIDNMTLIMPTASRRTTQADTAMPGGASKAKKKKRDREKKRDKDKETAASLMVACLKRLLPVGLNLFAGREQELVQHCKDRFLKREGDTDIIAFAKNTLTLPDKIDPSDKMSWQHHLYSKLGSKKAHSGPPMGQALDMLVERIIAMAKVLYGLHMIDHPQAKDKNVYRSVVSSQRKRAVIACFTCRSLHQLPRHRAINIFLRSYKEIWLEQENVGQEIVIEDLTISFEEAEKKKKEDDEEEEKPDPLNQLVAAFCRHATTETSGDFGEDPLYMDYANLMARSCGEEEEEGGDEEGGEEGGAEEDATAQQEMEKQKLLFHQARLNQRGVAEMVLLYISACKGLQSGLVNDTLKLGISILRGGNQDIQLGMLNHLKEKKDVGFFTSIAGLMSSCSVLDLDAFERNTKAEGLGVGSEGAAGQKNMHDAEFTCVLFRFIQLTCEGHNLEWQNYLRTQAGNTTTVNVVICTVDYLLRLQESIMDFYWHYSSKDIIDPSGKSNFFKAIGVASQVFNTLTEVIQGPCALNQQALAHSRLWDAVGGFMFLFAHMQDKLSKHSSQVDLLNELLNLQKDMVIMMLSMLEGNVMNGTIGKQMVDTLVESASNVEMILKFFDMFLKLKDLTSSASFQECDQNHDGWITPKQFREKMEQQKVYTNEEINFLLMCTDTNHDGKIDYIEFTERFHNPAKDIGFNWAVLLTNLSEHMPNDPRLARFLETAGSVLNYFDPFLGRIEVMGGTRRIERVYFEINESNIEQWEKPQIKESKRAFFYSIVTEGGDKEKLEAFVNFCEDAIFEMQHADSLMAGEEEEQRTKARDMSSAIFEEEEKGTVAIVKEKIGSAKDKTMYYASLFSPGHIKKKLGEVSQMSPVELVKAYMKFLFNIFYYSGYSVIWVIKRTSGTIASLMRGPPEETQEVEEEEETDFMKKRPSLPALKQEAEDQKKEEEKKAEEAAKAAEAAAKDKPAEGEEAEKPPEEETSAKALGAELALNLFAGMAQQPPGKEEDQEEAAEQVAALTKEEEVKETVSTDEKPAVSQLDFSEYAHKIVSLLARNFYNLKYVALALAFAINFILLFYRVSTLGEDDEDGGGSGEEPTSAKIIDDDGSDEDGGLSDIIDAISASSAEVLDKIGSAAAEAMSGENDDDGGGSGEEEGSGEDDEDPEEWVHFDEKYFYLEHIIRTLAVLHSIASLCMLVAYYHLKVPLAIFKREKEVSRKLEFDGLYLTEKPEDGDIKALWDKLVISTKSFPNNYWDKFVKKKVRQKYSETFDFDSISNLLGMEKTSVSQSTDDSSSGGIITYLLSIDWRYQLWKTGVTFTDNSFLYSLYYFTFSILGNINYFFFAAHLLDVAVGFKTLRTILQSVTHNGKQLVLTVMLLTIIVYIYTVVAFNFFRKFYVQEEDDQVDKKCHDMLTCFVFHMYKGVRAGGGIGDEIEDPGGDDNEVYRIMFDITFFFFVIVILLAIIQGLIIDAFGELRDQLQSVDDELESNCFICGIGKDYFDKVPHGFDTHVAKEHNLANYLFFVMHLINKDDTEYTGQETYVWNMYEQRCWDFFPVGECFRKQYEDELGGGGS